MGTVTVGKDRELVRGLKRKGYTASQIAKLCKLSPNSVSYLLYDRNTKKKKAKRDAVLATTPDKDVAAAAAAEAASEAIAAAATKAVVELGSEKDIETTISVPASATVEHTCEIPLRFKISVGVVS